MRFMVACSCKTWIGYAGNEAEARALGQTHLSEVESSRSLVQVDGTHVVTVRPDLYWVTTG